MTKGNGIFKWYAAVTDDAEIWQGAFDDRESAIQRGKELAADYESDTFVITRCDKSMVSPSFDKSTIAEQIIESLAENNEECWGEDGYDDAWTDDQANALEQKIQEAVTAWLLDNPGKTWSLNMGNIETINIKDIQA